MAEENEIKEIFEKNPIALATTDKEGNPYCIAAAFAKVEDNKIVITNNYRELHGLCLIYFAVLYLENCDYMCYKSRSYPYMQTTIKNIEKNKNVCLVVWDKDWKGYQIKGKTEYFEAGEWFDYIKSLKENKNEPCKWALVVTIKQIKKLS